MAAEAAGNSTSSCKKQDKQQQTQTCSCGALCGLLRNTVEATEMESGCMACGGSDHSYRTCVQVGAAIHRRLATLDPGKDMTDVVEIILRLLVWGWREARFGEEIMCLSYTPRGDVIAAGGGTGSIFFMSAQTGENILCPLSGHSR